MGLKHFMSNLILSYSIATRTTLNVNYKYQPTSTMQLWDFLNSWELWQFNNINSFPPHESRIVYFNHRNLTIPYCTINNLFSSIQCILTVWRRMRLSKAGKQTAGHFPHNTQQISSDKYLEDDVSKCIFALSINASKVPFFVVVAIV